MSTLLHIQLSPRKERSASNEVAQAFIDSFQKKHADAKLVTFNIWEEDLPEFNQDALNAKYAGLNGQSLTESQAHAWEILKKYANLLHEADVILLSVPLWNFGIPYKLKQFIDLVSQKDILFTFHPDRGLEGILQNKKAVGIYARGLQLSKESNYPAEQFDFQKSYTEAWLNFIGVSEIYSVIVDKTIFGEEVDKASRKVASEDARLIAGKL